MMKFFLAALLALLPLAAEASNCSSNPFTLTNGQTADATQVMSNFNNLLNCANNNLAHNGANSDITSILGLTTPLSAFQGGSGVQSPTANNVLLGNGASPFQVVPPQTSGSLLKSNGTTWSASTVGSFQIFRTTPGGLLGAGPLTAFCGSGGCTTVAELLTLSTAPSDATTRNLRAITAVPPGTGGTFTYTLRKNSADTTMTCTISGSLDNTCSDITHTAAFTASVFDAFDIKVVANASAASTAHSISVEFDP